MSRDFESLKEQGGETAGDFLLSRHVAQGVDELKQEKLSPLLKLRYRDLNGAFDALRGPDRVHEIFVGFQKHLCVVFSYRGDA